MSAEPRHPPRPVLLVTGLSGAGKASILRTLEDLGFETVDNPPLPILAELVADGDAPLAIGVDARSRGFDAAELLRAIARLRADPGIAANLIFATAEEPVLLRRFSETRRRHPLAPGGPLGSRVTEGIAREAALLAPLRDAADLVLDTSDLPLPELRRQIERRFRPENAAGLAIGIVSFGFPKGLPREADLVWDVRFLRNPHYDPALRPLTGRDASIAGFVESDATYRPFWDRMTGMMELLLPRYAAEGKKYLTVAIGCTGGRHRSVLVAERLASHLETLGWRVDLIHRDLAAPPKPGGASAAGQEALAHTP
ncbi:RNase adapter RapZ [Falsiroseomonas selenitidurans]|uniref:RNase adapter RapZ n=1 Tax=Falsiroseomonas selenitidurans TaxID=2716335 RepID=A0ABX1E618_9PROT|nr:RNase adapter RapZ [Falsiroseomonas selenitidurans]NKC32619.1 RNase adapter RapZ [Falsiroseomonas selenitidurans]